jgi:hypothetical protein
MGIGRSLEGRNGDRTVFVDIDDSWEIILLLTVHKDGAGKFVLLLDLPVYHFQDL